MESKQERASKVAENASKNATALRDWMESVIQQRGQWNYPHGVEANARDALDIGSRLVASVVELARQVAELSAAIAEDTAKVERGEDGE